MIDQVNGEDAIYRTMNSDELNAMCLTIQQCLVAARVSIHDGLEIHSRMLLSVLLTLNNMDREKASADVQKIMGQMLANLSDPLLDAQKTAQGGVLLQ